MKTIFPIIIISIVISLLEIPSLLKQKLLKELAIFTGLLIFALTLGIMQGLNIQIPNPFDLITIIFSPMTKIIQILLK